MYVIASVVGFATYLLIGPRAMWISVFTLMPVVSAVLIYWYLRGMHFPKNNSLKETALLVLFWISFSFVSDAATYILIIPSANQIDPNWTFFQDQSPWIWLCYAVLLVSGFAGRWMYVRKPYA